MLAIDGPLAPRAAILCYKLYNRLARVSARIQAARSPRVSNRLALISADAKAAWACFSACLTEVGVGW
jgi:hypothetical protein